MTSVGTVSATWNGFRTHDVPDLIEYQMSNGINILEGAVDLQDAAAVQQAAIDVMQSSLDLKLRHLPPAEIDFARLDLMTRQLLLDTSSEDAIGLRSDAAVLELIRDRISSTLDQSTSTQIDSLVSEIRTAADSGDFAAATDAGTQLHEILAS